MPKQKVKSAPGRIEFRSIKMYRLERRRSNQYNLNPYLIEILICNAAKEDTLIYDSNMT